MMSALYYSFWASKFKKAAEDRSGRALRLRRSMAAPIRSAAAVLRRTAAALATRIRYGTVSKGSEDEDGSGASLNSLSTRARQNFSASRMRTVTSGREPVE